MFETSGKKEIKEAVLISALCTLATGLVTWGIEVAKNKFTPDKKGDKDGKPV